MNKSIITVLSIAVLLSFAATAFSQQSQARPAPKTYTLIELQYANPALIAALFGGTTVPNLRLSQYTTGGQGGYGGTAGVGGYGASQGYSGQGGFRGSRSGNRQTGYGGSNAGW